MASTSCKKRPMSDRRETYLRRPEDDEDAPARKKMKKALIDIFNRSSLCLKLGDECIGIYLRVKPFTKDDGEGEKQGCFIINEEDDSVVAVPPELSHTYRNMKRGLGKTSHKFTFSRVFNDRTTQADFFNATMMDMTKEFITGQNSLVFTYGVTSSGKTYTIQGKPEDAGILPRCLDVLFNSINNRQIPGIKYKPHLFTDVMKLSPEEEVAEKRMKAKLLRLTSDTSMMTFLGNESESVLSDTMASCASSTHEDSLTDVENRVRENLKLEVDDNENFRFSIWISFAEIYNDQIYDLLVPLSKKNARRPTLKICDDRTGSPYIKGLREIHVETADEAYKLLTIGQHNLQTASTRLNQCSSRSHSIFTIKIIRTVDKDDPNIAKMNMLSLCDLAGSERSSQTREVGERLKEAGNINNSLMTLSRCIETLRYNQVHREHPKMVPFRDSKLTRLFQNFFNGSGRAAMIVNVSQSASLFDETLNVFKFSAIAKQVKYIAKLPEPTKMRKKVVAHCQRASIPWEDPEKEAILEEASNEPLPDVDEEEDQEETDLESIGSISSETVQQMEIQMKMLIEKNAQLAEMLREEVINSGNIEIRVRKEVTDAMCKQMVLMEQTYSDMLKESREDAQEDLEDRIQKVIDLYEEKLEKVQRQMDDEDEWVSSCLFYREERKVEERDEKIVQLENENEKMASLCKSQETLIASLKRELKDMGAAYQEAEDQLCQQKKEMKSHQAEMDLKLQNKDGTIKTLEEECRQMQEEIERLQDQMSQMDELSRKCEPDISNSLEMNRSTETADDRESNLGNCHTSCRNDQIHSEETAVNTSQVVDTDDKAVNTSQVMDTDDKAVNTSQTVDTDDKSVNTSQVVNTDDKSVNTSQVVNTDDKSVNTSQMVNTDDKSVNTSQIVNTDDKSVLISQIVDTDDKAADMSQMIKTDDVSVIMSPTTDTVAKSVHSSQLYNTDGSNESTTQNQENGKLGRELDQFQACQKGIEQAENSPLSDTGTKIRELNGVIAALRCQVHGLEVENLSLREKSNVKKEETVGACPSPNVITEMVHDLERKTTPSRTRVDDHIEDSPDDEIFFKPSVPGIKKATFAENGSSNDIAAKLKSCELANAALRSKLKREEEDFFKREQALIHGYTAEIDNLRHELARQKYKIEADGQAKASGNEMKDFMSDIKLGSEGMVGKESLEKLGMGEGETRNARLEVLSGEVTSLKEELLSSRTAYKQLQLQDNGNDTNSFIKSVVLGTPSTDATSQGQFRSEDNVTDSTLQFEIAESALKIEELKSNLEKQRWCLEKKEKEMETILKKTSHVESILEEETRRGLHLENVIHDKEEEIFKLQHEVKRIDSKLKLDLENSMAMSRNLENVLEEVKKENSALKGEVQERASEVEGFEKKIQELDRKLEETQRELTCKGAELEDMSAKLHTALASKSDLSSYLRKAENRLEKLEKEVQNNEDMQKQINGHKKDLEEATSQLEDVLEAKKSLCQEIDKMKELHQEESASVSQKLLLLEREKRTAEKKMAELLKREETLQSKCEDLGKMQEVCDQLRQELASKENETRLCQQQYEELKLALEKQELVKNELAVERDLRVKAEALASENSSKLSELRLGLYESEETMETQDKFLKELESMVSSLTKKEADLSREKKCLKDELSKLSCENISNKQTVEGLRNDLGSVHNEKQQIEKELVKQESLNKRNREEMENWKKERDETASCLEKYLDKLKDENKELIQNNERLKRDNADMAKSVAKATSAKDALMAELRKSNNTLSIQLASVQGLSPPPKIATPNSLFPLVKDFEDDFDTTAHIEIDATPPIAAKKIRKRTGSKKNSSSVDPDDSSMENPSSKKCLRTIQESEEISSGQENSPLRSHRNFSSNRLTDILSGFSPLTRSTKKDEDEIKKNKVKTKTQPPFQLQSNDCGTENVPGTRRSSRLRGKQKHSVV